MAWSKSRSTNLAWPKSNNGFLQDGYINVHYWDEAQFGKFKEPVGLERLQSGADLLFIERGDCRLFSCRTRDVGVQPDGKISGNTLAYQVGCFNGVEDGGSGDIEVSDERVRGKLPARRPA